MDCTNTNPKTGIRYGIVSLNSLQDWVFDEFLNSGRNLTCEDNYECDEEEYELETDGMKLGLTYLGGAALVWVFDSPHTTQARLCSPCVPNCGDLNSLDPDNGYECYTLPADWFYSEEGLL